MERHLRTIFEQEPFGELERLITQTLVDVVKRVARAELRNEDWLRMMARFSARSYEAAGRAHSSGLVLSSDCRCAAHPSR